MVIYLLPRHVLDRHNDYLLILHFHPQHPEPIQKLQPLETRNRSPQLALSGLDETLTPILIHKALGLYPILDLTRSLQDQSHQQ